VPGYRCTMRRTMRPFSARGGSRQGPQLRSFRSFGHSLGLHKELPPQALHAVRTLTDREALKWSCLVAWPWARGQMHVDRQTPARLTDRWGVLFLCSENLVRDFKVAFSRPLNHIAADHARHK